MPTAFRGRYAARRQSRPQPSRADLQREVSHVHSLLGRPCSKESVMSTAFTSGVFAGEPLSSTRSGALRYRWATLLRSDRRASQEASLHSGTPSSLAWQRSQGTREREVHTKRVCCAFCRIPSPPFQTSRGKKTVGSAHFLSSFGRLSDYTARHRDAQRCDYHFIEHEPPVVPQRVLPCRFSEHPRTPSGYRDSSGWIPLAASYGERTHLKFEVAPPAFLFSPEPITEPTTLPTLDVCHEFTNSLWREGAFE